MLQAFFSWFTSPVVENAEPLYRTREIWVYARRDARTGRLRTEPVLVFRKASDGMFWGLPLTNVGKKGKPLYVPRLKNGKKIPILAQMRTLKADRLVKRLGKAGEKEFATLHASIVRRLAETAQIPVMPRARASRTSSTRYAHALSSPFPVYVLQPR